MTTRAAPRTAAVAAALAAAVVLTAASGGGADPSAGSDDAHARAVTAMEEAVAAQSADAESATVTDDMRRDATIDLRPDVATFVLRPQDATTELERTQEKEDDTVVTLTSDLLFEFGSADLTPAARTAVAELADDVPQDATVHVDGHTDSVGGQKLNLRLSTERAEAVAQVLGDARPDLDLEVEGHGEDDPVAENEVGGEDNPAGRALNRRVEVTYPAS